MKNINIQNMKKAEFNEFIDDVSEFSLKYQSGLCHSVGWNARQIFKSRLDYYNFKRNFMGEFRKFLGIRNCPFSQHWWGLHPIGMNQRLIALELFRFYCLDTELYKEL